MAIRERYSGWQIDVSVMKAGKRVRHREQFEGSKAEAQLREATIKASLSKGDEAPLSDLSVKSKSLTLWEAFDTCHRKYWDGTASMEQNIRYCKEFMEFAGKFTPIKTLTTEQIEIYAQQMKDKGLAPSTRHSKLSVISKMITHHQDVWDKKPRVSFPKGKRVKRLRYLSDDEVSNLLDYFKFTWGSGRIKVRAGSPSSLDWYDFFVFYLDTGMRPIEIRSITERDIDGDCVHVWKTKSGEPRTIPLTKRGKEALSRQLGLFRDRVANTSPFGFATNNAIQSVWSDLRIFMQLEQDTEFVPYVCRHTCATRLYRKTRDLLVVQQWMGHSNINQTLTYAKLFPTALMAARDALDADVVE